MIIANGDVRERRPGWRRKSRDDVQEKDDAKDKQKFEQRVKHIRHCTKGLSKAQRFAIARILFPKNYPDGFDVESDSQLSDGFRINVTSPLSFKHSSAPTA